jgi:hypothetical protein
MTEPTKYRVQFVIDDDARFEECNGESRPLTAAEYRENQYLRDGTPVPYAEYLRYYGNPDRHVYLACIVQKQCHCCSSWPIVGSLCNIDNMDDSPEYRAITLDKWYAPDDPAIVGYLREVAAELIAEDNANG